MFEIINDRSGAALVRSDNVAFTFSVHDNNPREFDKYRTKSDSLQWDKQAHIGEFMIFPYGDYNDLPTLIKNIIANNPTAPGLLAKKRDLVWGQGPQLYTETIENGTYKRMWVQDDEVLEWLNSWDYNDYLMKCVVDYNHMEATFTKFVQRKGGRIGKPKFIRLEHVATDRGRLAVPINSKQQLKPTHAVVTDWGFRSVNAITDYRAYRLFDYTKPFAFTHAMMYSNMYSFCQDYYTVPDIYGSLEWIRRATAIPFILKNLSDNSLNIKYHIESPGKFWENKREQIESQCLADNVKFKESMFIEWKNDFLQKIATVLSGETNVGKFIHTESVLSVDGVNLLESGWKIKELDQKIKNFVDSQITISNRADRAVSAGIGLHGALGNINESARSNSGSEQLYALKNYLATGIHIPETIITKPLNYALKANFPTKNLKVGFYHMAAKAEEEIHSGDRMKEQIKED